MRLVGLPVPTVWNPPLLTPVIFGLFFFAAALEEIGYSGYVTDPMQGNSVFAAILFHAVTNTGRSVFPGSLSALELGDAAVAYGLITITGHWSEPLIVDR